MSENTPIPRYRLALCAAAAAAAAGLTLVVPAAPAHAQPYDAYDTGPSGEVTIYASPRAERDPYTGAPYDRVETSRVVSYADLDLNSRWGVHELHVRVVRAARDACSELDNSAMIVDSDDAPCVSTAVHRAMYQAPIPDYFQDDAAGY